MKYAGNETITALAAKIREALGGKLDRADVVDDLTSAEGTKALSAAQGKVLAERIAANPGGDMEASVYDPDGDGKVVSAAEADSARNAEKLGGKAPEDYLLGADMAELVEEDIESLWNA